MTCMSTEHTPSTCFLSPAMDNFSMTSSSSSSSSQEADSPAFDTNAKMPPTRTPRTGFLSKGNAVVIYLLRPKRCPDTGVFLAESGPSPSDLARSYNVASKTIRDIWNRVTWSSATRPYWDESELAVDGNNQQGGPVAQIRKPGRPPGAKDSVPRRKKPPAADDNFGCLPSSSTPSVAPTYTPSQWAQTVPAVEIGRNFPAANITDTTKLSSGNLEEAKEANTMMPEFAHKPLDATPQMRAEQASQDLASVSSSMHMQEEMPGRALHLFSVKIEDDCIDPFGRDWLLQQHALFQVGEVDVCPDREA
eukprot:CAMPEP_0181323972 /NCGR_PEP_ID=MMETSP1101-20121128/20088_1 /TAXON_ID=46948 /ORGANISM="Rhodomonas abbreviata, Strain Caron Lab Isolate" /LENGTH=305 /DNA_ID=CAMNT_0023432071 /DNA_START=18 /DNA_END=935 /DNA_ORIENTATION=+